MEMDMLNIIVRIETVDMEGFVGREHHPTSDMVGCFVRITNMDTIPPVADEERSRPDFDTRDREGYDTTYQIFTGILLDANGHDIKGGEVELIDHEIQSHEGIPVLFSELLA
jgi:hypothetical protein